MARGKLETALEQYQVLCLKGKMEKKLEELRMIKSRFYRLKKDSQKSLINSEDHEIRINRLINSLFQLINTI